MPFFSVPEREPAVASGPEGPHAIGQSLPVWTIIPFAGILLSIALCPLLTPHFWHRHFGKASAFWALLFALPFLYVYRDVAFYEILHIFLIDYIPFIILLWGLFTISGGIVLKGSLRGTPAVNTVMLLIGTLLASLIGTTGASMVMIRPVLRANKQRVKKGAHLLFFHLPRGQYRGLPHPARRSAPLSGIPAQRPLLLGDDARPAPHAGRLPDPPGPLLSHRPVSLPERGAGNHCCRPRGERASLSGSRASTISPSWPASWGSSSSAATGGPVTSRSLGIDVELQNLLRDGVIIALGLLSLYSTPKRLREANEFSWFPILEVAKLFAAIFVTIIPALAILKAGSHGALAVLVTAVETPAHYFWASGILVVLPGQRPHLPDLFQHGPGENRALPRRRCPAALAAGTATANPVFISYLQAVSVGAVFMGANTYIGNAPNFMVKSIAEEAGVNMPSFFGYMFKYSIPILIPVFILITFIFF